MAVETTTGPVITTGNTDPLQNGAPEASASLCAYSDGLPDPRLLYATLGAAPSLNANHIFGFTNQPYCVFVNAVPAAAAVARIAAAANVVSGTAMTLVSAQGAGVSPQIPIVPFGAGFNSLNVVKVLALDFGSTTGNTTSGSANVTIPAGAYRYYTKGQNIIVAGAGVGGLPLATSVASISGTTLVMAAAASTSVTGAQIGSADPNVGLAAWPYRPGGPVVAAKVWTFDPNQGIARAVSITGSASATGGAFKVAGYDIFGQAMTETITAGAGAVTTNGRKAFKYIASVTPQFTDAHAYSVGTTDIFGFNLRADFYEYMAIVWNGANITANTGWLAADATSPATSVTGDVRGTYAVQSGSDGTKRLTIMASLADFNLYSCSNLDASSLVGVTQA